MTEAEKEKNPMQSIALKGKINQWLMAQRLQYVDDESSTDRLNMGRRNRKHFDDDDSVYQHLQQTQNFIGRIQWRTNEAECETTWLELFAITGRMAAISEVKTL